jgi:hypothetical protein
LTVGADYVIIHSIAIRQLFSADLLSRGGALGL